MNEIRIDIEKADILLYMISPDSVSSKWCRKDIRHAVQNGKCILPFAVRDARPEISRGPNHSAQSTSTF